MCLQYQMHVCAVVCEYQVLKSGLSDLVSGYSSILSHWSTNFVTLAHPESVQQTANVVATKCHVCDEHCTGMYCSQAHVTL